mgnify:CR=1 FL=1
METQQVSQPQYSRPTKFGSDMNRVNDFCLLLRRKFSAQKDVNSAFQHWRVSKPHPIKLEDIVKMSGAMGFPLNREEARAFIEAADRDASGDLSLREFRDAILAEREDPTSTPALVSDAPTQRVPPRLPVRNTGTLDNSKNRTQALIYLRRKVAELGALQFGERVKQGLQAYAPPSELRARLAEVCGSGKAELLIKTLPVTADGLHCTASAAERLLRLAEDTEFLVMDRAEGRWQPPSRFNVNIAAQNPLRPLLAASNEPPMTLFRTLDKDRDGYVTSDDIRAAFPDLQVPHGHLTFLDFCNIAGESAERENVPSNVLSLRSFNPQFLIQSANEARQFIHAVRNQPVENFVSYKDRFRYAPKHKNTFFPYKPLKNSPMFLEMATRSDQSLNSNVKFQKDEKQVQDKFAEGRIAKIRHRMNNEPPLELY